MYIEYKTPFFADFFCKNTFKSRNIDPRIKVKAGSKLRNLIPTSIGAFQESGLVVFTGSGPAVTKA
jgi:hypothetical protein